MGGFSAVLGNPPWLRQEEFKPIKGFLSNYQSYSSAADLSVYFVELGYQSKSKEGAFGMLIPNKWMKSDYGENLRKYVKKSAYITQLIDFGHSRMFKDAITFPCSLIYDSNAKSTQFHFAEVDDRRRLEYGITKSFRLSSFEVDFTSLKDDGWNLIPKNEAKLMHYLESMPLTLSDFVEGRMLLGYKTGANEAYTLSEEQYSQLTMQHPEARSVIKQLCRGRNIRRWSTDSLTEYLIVIPSSAGYSHPWSDLEPEIAEERFHSELPSVYRHLLPYKQKLTKRSDKGKFWWEQRSCDYVDLMNSEKIGVKGIIYNSEFCFVDKNTVLNNSSYFLPTKSKFVLALINSRIAWWYYDRTLAKMKDDAYYPHIDKILSLPIPDVPNVMIEEIEQMTSELLDNNFQQNSQIGLEHELNSLITKCYMLDDDHAECMINSLNSRDPLRKMEFSKDGGEEIG